MRRRLCGLAAITVLCVGTLVADPAPAEAAPLPDWPTTLPPRLLPDPDTIDAALARVASLLDTREQAERDAATALAQVESTRVANVLDIERDRQFVPSNEEPKLALPPAKASWVHAWITDEILWELRQCESTNRYDANTGNGFRGAVQWLQATWNAAARTADRPDLIGVPPNLAAPADQDYLTKVWWSVSDYRGQWPVCGPLAVRRAG